MAKLTKGHKRQLIQFIEYLISGGAYFWSGYGFYWLADKKLGWAFWGAKLSASLVGWTVNFVLQRYWVFRNPALRGHLTQITGRYLFITLVDFGLDLLIVGWLKAVGVTPYIGQFISAGFFTGWNYLWYRFWVFPEKLARHRPARHGLLRIFAHRAHGHPAYHTITNLK
ncbi:GtrA family protein [Candidatus Saccharibacteria bacterium]|nr:GtrA family protein [Candidatus Saccharibacteria bacterium]